MERHSPQDQEIFSLSVTRNLKSPSLLVKVFTSTLWNKKPKENKIERNLQNDQEDIFNIFIEEMINNQISPMLK